MHWDNFWLGFIFGAIGLVSTTLLIFIYFDSREYAKNSKYPQTKNNEE